MSAPHPRAAHVALLLAAGGSTRLGRPKQLLMRAGEPLVRRTARLLADTRPRRLLVVVGAHRDAVTAALDGVDCERIDNDDWRAGLSSSLRAAALALPGHAGPVLMCGCDQPALEAAHLAALLSGARTALSGCAATLHAGLPGIPALVPADWLAQASLLAGDAGFGAHLRALPRDALCLLDAQELALDIDTPRDLQDARRCRLLDPGA